jgi:hypothetical protein
MSKTPEQQAELPCVCGYCGNDGGGYKECPAYYRPVVAALRSRLAEVEKDRDTWHDTVDVLLEIAHDLVKKLDEARARIDQAERKG